MKTPVELAISQMQALHIQHRCAGSYQIKVRPSHVEETLFGSPAGTRPIPPDLDTSWSKKANRTRGVGTGCHRHQGQGELWIHLLQWQHPNPHTKEEQIQTDQADPFLLRWDPFLLRWVSLRLMTREHQLGGQVDGEGRHCKAPCPLLDNPSYP